MEVSCEGLKSNIELRYDVLMKIATFGVVLIDLAGNIIEVNRAALELLGSPSGEATKNINMLSYPPLEKVGVSQMIRDAFSEGVPICKVVNYVSKWRRQSLLKCCAYGVKDSNSEVCFVALSMEDISELEELKDKHFKLARTLISIIDGIEHYYIWAKDKSGTYHIVSKSYAALFNLLPNQMVGKKDTDFFDEEMADAFRQDDLEVLAICGEKIIEEPVHIAPRGYMRWKTIKNAVYDDEGNPSLVVGIAEDVTNDCKRRENARKAIQELENFISRNTARNN